MVTELSRLDLAERGFNFDEISFNIENYKITKH